MLHIGVLKRRGIQVRRNPFSGGERVYKHRAMHTQTAIRKVLRRRKGLQTHGHAYTNPDQEGADAVEGIEVPQHGCSEQEQSIMWGSWTAPARDLVV